MTIAYALAWLAPFALGTSLVAVLGGRPRTSAEMIGTAGTGWVLGALLSSTAIAPFGSVEVSRIVPMLAPVFLALALGAWYAAAVRGFAATACAAPVRRVHPLVWLLLVLLVLRIGIMAEEILLRPMYPWDSWAAWLLKPKAWMLSGHIDAFVPFDDWIQDASGTLRTSESWSYPETVGRLAIWFASAWGSWNAGVVGLVWLAFWFALLAGTFGQLRALGLGTERALIAAYALGSLPLIDVHVALAGYADLWVAIVLAFACLSWMRWLDTRRIGHLVLAALFALMLPLIKLEGRIWLVLFAACVFYERMGPTFRVAALLLAPVIGMGTVAAYLLRWPLITPALDRIGLTADIDVLLDHAPGVVGAAAEGLFVQYNWHLFWFALALTLALRWRCLRNAPALRMYGLFLLLGCGFLFALFVLTPAGQWAESYTAVNRLSLQIVPAMLAFAALLWRDTASETPHSHSAPRVAANPATAP